MYRQSELSNSITPEEIIRTLSLCGITQKEQYTEDEADCFRECRKLIEQGKTDSEVIEALKQRDAVATKVLPKPKRQKILLAQMKPSQMSHMQTLNQRIFLNYWH